MIKTFRIILVIIWMLIIFSFSQTNGEKSGGSSTKLIHNSVLNISKTLHKLKIINKPLSEKQAKKIAENLNYPVRKCMHITEYFILALLVYYAIVQYKVKRIYLLTYLISVTYAISDEIHQLFTGRTSSFRDVLIDSIGILLAIGLVYSVNKRKTNKA